MYEEALQVEDVVGIVIGTRPDCVSDELLDYLEALNRRTFVLVEYGIESANDETLKRINLLIADTLRDDPFEGIGKPEPLKHALAGAWSRRIDEATAELRARKDEAERANLAKSRFLAAATLYFYFNLN